MSTVDTNEVGEEFIEIGRYDNQDLNAIVDDIFVFGDELSVFEANAIRNLRLSLDLSPEDADVLFDMFDAGAGGAAGGLNWSLTSGLDSTNPGGVLDLGGGRYGLVLDSAGNGLVGVPEPSAALLACVGAFSRVMRRRR